MSAVVIEHLSQSYGQREALSDLSLRIEPGEIFGLLGPNGSGKTTLFRILSTVLPIQQGTVRLFDVDVAGDRDGARRLIGVVFQSASLDKHLSARENLLYHGKLFGLAGAALQQRVESALQSAGLADRANDRIGTFSGGMRQRVEVAKGLLHRPRILLMDEPSTGLDPAARLELWSAVRAASQAGVTVVLTTHLLEEAEKCDRLAILAKGKLVVCDSPEKLKASIGGEVITMTSKRPEELLAKVQHSIATGAALVDGVVRLERPDAHRLVPVLIEAAPGLVETVSVGRPTLNDVFIALTGRSISTDDADVEQNARPAKRR